MMPVAKNQTGIKRLRLEIRGVVQGVGFRPFVYLCAKKFDVQGFVGNESRGVFLEIEGDENNLKNFIDYLKSNAPPLSHISEILIETILLKKENDFRIIESAAQENEFTLISPDVSICEDCRRELFDSKDRRYLYPFINCTNCGPRFTITRTVPYDRPNTTMAKFAMCEACRSEYENPLDRRFHAQPVSCWNCGVQAWFESENFTEKNPRRAVGAAREFLKKGFIAAIKGIGGFHLACDARNETAVAALRARKGRVDKPFAVMCRDAETAEKFVEMSDAERAVLLSKERPIVLLKKRSGNDLSKLIAPNNQFLGVMLPYSPLHHLLFDAALDTLVMTSGNFSNEPIVKDNDEAREKLVRLADGFLFHDRDIFVQCDDSVLRIADCGLRIADLKSQIPNPKSQIVLPVRRSRGFAPFPVELPFKLSPILAVGGELKATFCLTKENFAFMSQHIGDMENLETLQAFENAAEQMKRLFRVAPEAVAGDLHPNYLSSRWAQRNFPNFIAVQHHHAHLAAVMAENNLPNEKTVGFTFDGTGYGTDGKIWGGEVLLGDYETFTRLAHLRYFPLAGGDVSVKKVYRIALSLLREAGIDWSEDLQCAAAASETERKILLKQLENNFNLVETSSFGRLFDAVASIAGIRQTATYEAQAAIELEAVLEENAAESYEFDLIEGETILIDYRRMLREIVADLRAQTPQSIIAAKFHNAAANLILRLSLKFRDDLNLNKIALSGGCFQNVALLQKTLRLLHENDFEVFTHRRVPPNDGGLALGQAVIAGFRLQKRNTHSECAL